MLTTFIFSLLGVSQAYGSSFPHPFGTAFGHLSPRQFTPPTSPSQCRADCDPIGVQLQKPGGCTAADCCKVSFVTGYFNCLKCVGEAEGVKDFSSGQFAIDEIRQQCIMHGFNVPVLTFPGVTPNTQSPAPAPAPAPSRPTNLPSVSATRSSVTLSTLSPTLSPGIVTFRDPVSSPTGQLTITSVDLNSVPQPAQPTEASSTAVSSNGSTSAARSSSFAIISVLFTGFVYLLV